MIADDIIGCGLDETAEIKPCDIPFDTSLTELCKMNTCGNYGKSYTCPPYVGKPEDLIDKVKGYCRAVVFKKVYRIADSFDIEGMQSGKENFIKLVDDVDDLCKKRFDDYLILGAGGCTRCKTCGVVDNIACRYPKKAIASLESHCIFVSELAKKCGMNYISGKNTVTYFGMVLFERP